MRGRFNSRTTTAIAVATAMALVGAGGATAGSLITGAKIKNSSVTGADIRNGSLSKRDIGSATVSQLSATDARTRAEASAEIPAYDAGTVTVSCPDGQVATGGGGTLVNEPRGATLVYSVPITAGAGEPPTGWQIRIKNGNQTDTAKAYAVCTP